MRGFLLPPFSRLWQLWPTLPLLAALAGCRPAPVNPSDPAPTEGRLTYVQIDVGQGDSELIVSPDGHAMLVDAGPPGKGDEVLAVLKQYGVERLDYLVESHPHADHIGGMKAVIEHGPPVGTFLASGYRHKSQVQVQLLREIRDRKIKGRYVTKGERFKLGESVTVEVLQPEKPLLKGTESDPNNNSVVMRISYGNTAFLLTGDMEKEERARLLTTRDDLQSDVLKVAHHGSHDGTDPGFIRRVRPRFALLSLERGNEYGHPHGEAVEILENAGAAFFRTDLQGNITLTSDGNTIDASVEKNAPVSLNLTGKETAARLGDPLEGAVSDGRDLGNSPDNRRSRTNRKGDGQAGEKGREERKSREGTVSNTDNTGRRSSSAGPEEDKGSVIGNRRTRVYHLEGAGTTLPAPENRVTFDTEQDAREAGYRPARR